VDTSSPNRNHVAIKKLRNAFDYKTEAQRTLREIKLLRSFQHENVRFDSDLF